VSFEPLENRESFGILSSTIIEGMSVFEGILSLTRTVSLESTYDTGLAGMFNRTGTCGMLNFQI
jgi:hypothetical protein